MQIDDILDDFDLLDEWDDRYRYLIELGKALPEFAEADRNERTKVEGCVSQVWLTTAIEPGADGPHMIFAGDSDAMIVRGIIAILIALYSGRPAAEILDTDAGEIFERIGLKDHLSRQRSNGLVAMVARIKRDAQAALAAT